MNEEYQYRMPTDNNNKGHATRSVVVPTSESNSCASTNRLRDRCVETLAYAVHLGHLDGEVVGVREPSISILLSYNNAYDYLPVSMLPRQRKHFASRNYQFKNS